MFIFGLGKRSYKVLGETKPHKCVSCTHERPFKYVEEKRWFTFFFIPIFAYKKRELIVCQVCGAGVEATDEISYMEIDSPIEEKKKRESILRSIKEKFDRGEISQNEYIRMVNVLKFESQHTH